MLFLILGIILLLAGAGASAYFKTKLYIAIGLVLAIIFIGISFIYKQEVGEAVIIRNADGTIVKTDAEAGFGLKAPWMNKITIDIKGKQAQYKLDGQATQENEVVNGPTITVMDKDKVPVDVDISIGYSIEADKIQDLYTEYKTEDVIFQRLIAPSIKSVIKDTANAYSVDELVSNRAAFAKSIEENLATRWDGRGISVDMVDLQTTRPPQSIIDRINATQESKQKLMQAEAQTKVKEEEARQKVIEAQGIADSNRILNDSLTDKVLQDKYIDALKNAKSLVVTPEGSTPMIGVPQP